MQGNGARKRSLDGKTNSPHYGGYTTHAVESGDPPHGVIVVVVVVVVVVCFLFATICLISLFFLFVAIVCYTLFVLGSVCLLVRLSVY